MAPDWAEKAIDSRTTMISASPTTIGLAIVDGRRRMGFIALFLLIAVGLGLDFFHGIALGERDIAFHPIYRLRQSLAVAISRMHDPSSRGYLAYGSVEKVLNENGFAVFNDEPGPHLDVAGWEKLLDDGERLDRTIEEAREVPIDPSLAPQIIQANELGFADYIELSFRLFGSRIASLYNFFFAIVVTSGALYILQFRRRPFPLFLLVLILAELYFLEDYARLWGVQLNSITNSRLFSGISLLPALHVLLVLWQRAPPRIPVIAGVIAQSLIFAFLLSCRIEVVWQLAAVIAVAVAMGLRQLLSPDPPYRNLARRLLPLWPAAVLTLVAVAYVATVNASVDARYATEPKTHIIWHEVMIGVLDASPALYAEYAGADHSLGDQMVYSAVSRDLTARNDMSSPIATRLPDGQIVVDLSRGWSEYDRLVQSLLFRIVAHHPLAVLAESRNKLIEQIDEFERPRSPVITWNTLRVGIILVAIAALACMAAGGWTIDRRTRRDALKLGAVLLLFALVTPMIHASMLSIGTLFVYLGAIAIAVISGLQLAAESLIACVAKAAPSPPGKALPPGCP
jgi:hypothetical protein